MIVNRSWILLLFFRKTAAPMAEVSSNSTGLTPTLQFTFLPEACHQRYFANEQNNSSMLLDGLLIPKNSTAIDCAPSIGVRQSAFSHVQIDEGGIVSEETFGNMFRTDNGISIEIWWKPSTTAEPVTVITFGDNRLENTNTASADAVTLCNRDSFDFQLVQVGTEIVAIFRTSDEWFEGCHMLRAENISSSGGELMHLVVSLSDRDQRIFVNGKAIQPSSHEHFPNDLSHWRVDHDHLYLLQYTAAAPANRSLEITIYRLAVYGNALKSDNDVELVMLRGLPPTPPFAYNQSVAVTEDADDGTHTVEWYAQPALPSDVTRPLNAPHIGWIDEQVRNLLLESIDWNARPEDLGWNHWILEKDLDPVYVYLTSLPDMGRLFFASDHTPLAVANFNAADNPILIPLGTAPAEKILIYLPPHNVFSNESTPLTHFSFCIAGSPIFDATQCTSSATVSIYVESINDPPVALPLSSPIVVTEGFNNSRSTKIPLRGYDVDFNDTITAIEITRPPTFGSLRLAVPTFRQDLLPHGTALKSLSYLIPGDDLAYVNYIWDPLQARVVIHGTSVKDSFHFRVRDRAGLWSAEKKVEVQIVTAVTGEAASRVIVQEDSEGELQWRGIDRSGYDRHIGFFIDKLPSPLVGSLVDPRTLKALRVGQTIQAFHNLTKEGSAGPLFLPKEDYCHSSDAAETKQDGEVRFRAVATIDNAIISVSASVSQQIIVSCSLDVISLALPPDNISVLESSLSRTTTDPCSGFNYTGEVIESHDNACEAAAIIFGVTLTSYDRRADLARVTVSSSSGFLTFNDRYWNRTEPIHGRQRMASGAVSFFAYPEDLTDILSNLHYQRYTTGTDSIEFDIQYGNCTDTDVQQRPGSFRTPTCQVVRDAILVVVLRDDAKYDSKTRIVVGFPWQILFCLLAYPALYLAVTYLQCSCSGVDDETVVEGTPLEPAERFIQHEDEHGMFYYEDTCDGSVRWDLPPGEDFVRFQDIVVDEA